MANPLNMNSGTVKRLRHPLNWLIAALVIRVVLALPLIDVPRWIGHEPDFYNTALTLVNQGRLPTAADFPGQDGVMLQATQPPLYYGLLVPVVALFNSSSPVPAPEQPIAACFGWNKPNPGALVTLSQLSDAPYYESGWRTPYTARIVLRTLNTIMACAVMVLVYASGRVITPKRPAAALIAALLIGFEPNTLAITVWIGNEPLLLLIAALYGYAAVRLLARRDASPMVWITLGVCTILALLTRLNGWVLLPVTGLIIGLSLTSGIWGALSRRARRVLLIAGGGLGLLVIAVLLVNLATTGSAFGRYRELEEVLGAGLSRLLAGGSVPTWIGAVLHETAVNSYLSAAAFLPYARAITAFGWLSLAVLMLGFGVGIAALWRGQRRTVLMLMALVGAAIMLVFARNLAALDLTTLNSTTLIYAPLRYYLPALPAAALIMGVGLSRFRVLIGLAAVLIVSWGLLTALDRREWAVDPLQPAVADSVDASATDPQFPQLYASSLALVSDGRLLTVRLTAGADQPLTRNYAAQLDFTDPSGRVSSCRFPVANGRYPTMWWPPDVPMTFSAAVPHCTGTLPAGTQVDLRWIAEGSESPPLPLGQLDAALSPAASCPAFLGSFDGEVLAQSYRAPLTLNAGSLYLPSINWVVQRPVSAVERSYQMTHLETGTIYTCSGEPRLNTYPFAKWTPGETVYFDECALNLPPDAPLGRYEVAVRLRDASGQSLPAFDSQGADVSSGWLTVASVNVIP
ncbi:MAG: hypothetical protein U0670_16185 [Anaerolineae bacterium]